MYKTIMVPLDGSELAECVLPHVKMFVSGCRVATIIFVRVVETAALRYAGASGEGYAEDLKPLETNLVQFEEERKNNAREYLQEVAGRFKSDDVTCRAEVLSGKVAESLVDYVETNAVDLVIIATHGRSGVSRWVRGSVADRILRASRSPVLMIIAFGTTGGSDDLKKKEHLRQPAPVEREWID